MGTTGVASTTREATAQAFEEGSSCRFSRESPLKEELSYPVNPIVGRSRSSQLISSEGLEGYGAVSSSSASGGAKFAE